MFINLAINWVIKPKIKHNKQFVKIAFINHGTLSREEHEYESSHHLWMTSVRIFLASVFRTSVSGVLPLVELKLNKVTAT